ncbi:GNAT family N-acetyltransferase [Palleronia caenipelagi]|uniref:GNAT family N-acetyltransferase n=1 Tax=Palleronia caenipelagi TaxID=2489174 RepID=A0A547Q079_9RHOB|nr:GNAT family N-acetyltransferase [Palleronia caenipelagi]TRD19779.1 GNAT family N-acetyltransferase [Palleronia caenipelagi]
MSASLRLARPEDTERVRRLVAACHEEAGLLPDPEARDAALQALLSGEVPGALYLIGPASSPLGYASLSFGHSLQAGGTEAHLEDLYIRPGIRGRGMGTEALTALAKMLGKNGVSRITTSGLRTGTSLLHRLSADPDRAPRLTLRLR